MQVRFCDLHVAYFTTADQMQAGVGGVSRTEVFGSKSCA